MNNGQHPDFVFLLNSWFELGKVFRESFIVVVEAQCSEQPVSSPKCSKKPEKKKETMPGAW